MTRFEQKIFVAKTSKGKPFVDFHPKNTEEVETNPEELLQQSDPVKPKLGDRLKDMKGSLMAKFQEKVR